MAEGQIDPLEYFAHVLRVTFTGAFPVDMLRVDRCTPAREADSHQIITSLDKSLPAIERVVYLTMYDVNITPSPVMCMWKNFGIHIDIEHVKKEEIPSS